MEEHERDREIEERARPAHEVGGGLEREERSEHREVAPREEPRPERLGLEQPVGVDLRDAREDVDDAELRTERPHRSGRDGARERRASTARNSWR